MKNIFSYLYCFLLFIACNTVQAQCSWVRGSSETDDYSADIWSVAYDESDNYYVTGAFRQEFTANGLSFDAPTKGQGYFVAKYDTDGNIIWGKVLESFAESTTFLPRIDRIGSRLYVAGVSVEELIVDGVSYGNNALDNFFLVGLTTEGVFEFVHTYTDSASSALPYVGGITHDQQNNIYLTGRFGGYLDWGPVTATSSSPTTFIAKFNSEGNFIDYDKTASPGAATSRGWPIEVDNENRIILGGYFQNTLSFNTCSQELSSTSAGFNPYIMKFDSAFNCEWMLIGDGIQEFSPVYGITTDAANNIYACGIFKDTINFDGVTLDNDSGNFFLLKIAADGTILWAKNFGNNADVSQAPTSLNIDAEGNIWVTGWYGAASDFGSISFSGSGIFAVKFDPDGNPIEGVTGEGMTTSYTSLIDNSGNVIIAGAAEGDEISFEGDSYTYSSSSSKGYYILRYYLDIDSCTADTTDPVGILQLEETSVMHIYPNPSFGSFTFTLPDAISGNVVASLIDVSGKTIFESAMQLTESAATGLHITCPSGIYVLKVIAQNKVYVGRLLIE
jgi:hypothetical protein